jgi:arsenite methyltransferase
VPDRAGSGMYKSDEVSPQNLNEIRNAIRNKYAEVALAAEGQFQYPTGRDGAYALGYDPAIIQSATPRLLASFCGVGNPFALGKLQPGDTVLDFGCGGGFDLYVAARLVGEKGLLCGVDLTEEMVKRAGENLAVAGITNFEIKKVDSEKISYEDNSFDVVISNGVINLSPLKQACFEELWRVLKPGGKIQFADVVLENELPSALAGSIDAWSQ